ncbi:STAS domain-containing protein [Cyanobacterium stanieri LEGE 03274]|uniref:Anti-sigma factor antagonist n=1 Tax=Cyanobacterium stanieri LEGE 03274 TaxID=1828756 RepID=A0ABR9V394_9CHRO|nr:STAS domain-containing protein [Cyanobacterium stanieri]MBE9222370.1 STAS domain-containing protein [Cyanobacterium stanieri LEGE 03274]
MLPKIKVLRPEGIFDGVKANEFRQDINKLIGDGVIYILVDFKKVTFMDSSGLGGLVQALKNIRSANGRLFLMSLNEQIKMLFELTNMGQVFEIVQDKSELGTKFSNS